MSEFLKFPDKFLWGVATSAHQVEGGCHNDWSEWEKIPGNIADGTSSVVACDHRNLFESDFELAKSLNQKAMRLSLEWSHIEPREGHFDDDAIAHYRKVLEALIKKGIIPIVTLHHFTNPIWFTQDGGWEDDRCIERFKLYTQEAIESFGDLVNYWITINEPQIYAYYSYGVGEWPPQKKGITKAVKVLKNMLKSHNVAYDVIHANPEGRTSKVGLAIFMRYLRPHNPWAPLDLIMTFLNDRLLNVKPLLNTLDKSDFVGINYYARGTLCFDSKSPATIFTKELTPKDAWVNDRGWEIYPQGLYELLMRIKRLTKKPILITENGTADALDSHRPKYLLLHLKELHRAITKGANVIGYFHWSLLDNFEWKEGLSSKFGLVEVDFANQRRTVRESGRLYSEICRLNGISEELERRAGL